MKASMFAIKAEVRDPRARTFTFTAEKTMYGGKRIAKGDTIFVFASENEGGQGLIASGVVTSAKAIAKKRGIARQTPRVSITIRRAALAKRRLGRNELKLFSDWSDGHPETELNFKFYRQATNKIVGDYFLKLASAREQSLRTVWFYLGFALYASTAFGWVFVMKHLKLATISVLYSVSLVLLLTAIGVVLFRESLNYFEVIGIVLAVVSLVLLMRFA